MHFVYILECRDGGYYVGSTHDVAQRLAAHRSGQAAAYTARRLPVRLIYQESRATLEDAIRREKQLKRWSRAKKEALASGKLDLLPRLAACTDL